MINFPKKDLEKEIKKVEKKTNFKILKTAPGLSYGSEGDIVFSHTAAGVRLHVKSNGQWWNFDSDKFGAKDKIPGLATYFFAFRLTDTADGGVESGDWGIPFSNVKGRGADLFITSTSPILIGSGETNDTDTDASDSENVGGESIYVIPEDGLYHFNLQVTLSQVKVNGSFKLSIYAMNGKKDVVKTLQTYFDTAKELTGQSGYIKITCHGTFMLSQGDSVGGRLNPLAGEAQDTWEMKPGVSETNYLSFFEGYKIGESH